MEFSSGLRQVEGQPVSRSDIDASYIPERQCQQEERGKNKTVPLLRAAQPLRFKANMQTFNCCKKKKKAAKKKKKNLPSADKERIVILLGRAEPTQTAC